MSKLKKYLIISVLTIAVIAILIIINQNNQEQPSEETIAPINEEDDSIDFVAIVDDPDTDDSEPLISEEIEDKDDSWLPHMESISISNNEFSESFTSHSFINDSIIASIVSIIAEEPKDFITITNRDDLQITDVVYETEKGKVVSSLLGLEQKLFWVEYNVIQQVDDKWDIKSLDLDTGKVELISSGVREEYNHSPILKIYNDQVTWIEKFISDNVVYSNLIVYETNSDSNKNTIATITLDKENERIGIFPIYQKPVEDGMLVVQSVFQLNEEKTYEIVHYHYDQSEPTQLVQHDDINDFYVNNKWFVWSELGFLHVIDRETNEEVYTIEDDVLEYDLDFYTLFVFSDILYYSYNGEQNFAFNLDTGDKVEISDLESQVAPLTLNGDLLHFTSYVTNYDFPDRNVENITIIDVSE